MDAVTDARKPVLLVRPMGNEGDAAALDALGIVSVVDPFLSLGAVEDPAAARAFLDALRTLTPDAPGALAVTSTAPVPVLREVLGRALDDAVGAAVATGSLIGTAPGERTAADLRALGIDEVVVPADEASAAGMVRALAPLAPRRLIHSCGTLALPTLGDGLRPLGWSIEQFVVYTTVAVADRPASADLVANGDVSAVVLRSPSAARALVAHCTPHRGVAIVCGGRTTAAAATDAGLDVIVVSASPAPADIARAVADAIATKMTSR